MTSTTNRRANGQSLPESVFYADHERLIHAHLALETPIAELDYILRAAECCFDYASGDDDLAVSGKFLVDKAREMATALMKQYDAIITESPAASAFLRAKIDEIKKAQKADADRVLAEEEARA